MDYLKRIAEWWGIILAVLAVVAGLAVLREDVAANKLALREAQEKIHEHSERHVRIDVLLPRIEAWMEKIDARMELQARKRR